MEDYEYQILWFIQSHRSVLWKDVLNRFDPTNRINLTNNFLKKCLKNGTIEKLWKSESPPKCRIRISGSGRALLASETASRATLTKQLDVDQKHDQGNKPKPSGKGFRNFIAVAGAVVGIAASILAIVDFLLRFL